MQRHRIPAEADRNQAEERWLQVGGALLLGAVVLLVILQRAHARGMLPAGWWRFW